MTPEQKSMWDHLCNNYPRLTHEMAAEIVQADKRWFYRKANKFLAVINTWPIEHAVSALCTWLTVYKMPLVPGKLSNFNVFHNRCGAYILSNTRTMKSFVIST